MIGVTGLQRSGTSLMMQTLKLLGLSVVGYEYHEQFSNVELNPRGYYDLPIEDTIGGVWINSWEKDVIKLYPAVLNISNFDLIKKLIVCKRNKDDVLKSTLKLLELEEVVIKPTVKNAENSITLGNMILNSVISKFKNPVLFVNYEDMIDITETTIQEICDFLELDINTNKACENIIRKELICQ